MNENNNLAHITWNSKYHIVYASEYRRNVLFQENRVGMGKGYVYFIFFAAPRSISIGNISIYSIINIFTPPFMMTSCDNIIALVIMKVNEKLYHTRRN